MVKYGKLDATFAALADPTRRSVLELLSRGESTVSDMARGYDISLPAFLKHVRVLESAGLVTTRKVGRVRYCRHSPAQLAAAEQWIHDQRVFWERQLDSLERYFTTPEEKEPRT